MAAAQGIRAYLGGDLEVRTLQVIFPKPDQLPGFALALIGNEPLVTWNSQSRAGSVSAFVRARGGRMKLKDEQG